VQTPPETRAALLMSNHKEILMRTALLISAPLLALVACENATEPLAPDGDMRQSLEASESGSYGATVLPDGVLSGKTYLAVDDNGGVFGSVMHGSGPDRAAKWSVDGGGNVTGPILLGTLPAPFDQADQYVSSASTHGDVVIGYAGSSPTTAGWVWKNGAMTMLPGPSDRRVYPLAANDAGVIVGQIGIYGDGHSEDWGAVWLPPYNAEPILLPRVEGYILNSARGITNEGIITGWVRSSGMIDALVQWQIDAEGNVLSGPEMLEGIECILMRAANQDRDVVGSFHGNDQWEPYLFRAAIGQHIELGSLNGYTSGIAHGLNNRSGDDSVQAVGISWTQSLSDGRAVLWSVDGSGTVAGPIDLGVPPAMVTRTRPLRTSEFVAAGAYSTNGQGWVVGWSEREDLTTFATLWRPNQNGGDDGGDDGGGDDCKPHPRTGECR
jgi:hypothetical protein